jgi:DNA-binding CsgD family transcriptional regulator
MATLEVWGLRGHGIVPLDGDRVVVGSSEDVGLVIDDDGAVSRVHMVLERLGGRWCVRDLGARNGTYVNGRRLFAERPLHDGDELLVGRTRLVFRERRAGRGVSTEALGDRPQLTARERDVLLELCRPVLGGNLFTEPASVREIAAALVVTEAAVKQHLGHLYDKFGLSDVDSQSRRVRLANEALRSGAVTLGDLDRPA